MGAFHYSVIKESEQPNKMINKPPTKTEADRKCEITGISLTAVLQVNMRAENSHVSFRSVCGARDGEFSQ